MGAALLLFGVYGKKQMRSVVGQLLFFSEFTEKKQMLTSREGNKGREKQSAKGLPSVRRGFAIKAPKAPEPTAPRMG